jgi:glucose-6-phosphate-specific signal transduction histidine kinase
MNTIQTVLRTENQTRREIAKKLHQELVQSLASLAMRAGLARKIAGDEPERAIQEINHLEEIARAIVQESRYLLYVLDPSPLNNEGLLAALLDWKQQFETLHNISFKFEDVSTKAWGKQAERDYYLFSLVVDLFEDLIEKGKQQGFTLLLNNSTEMGIFIELAYIGNDLSERVKSRILTIGGKIDANKTSKDTKNLQITFPLSFLTD